MKALIVDDEIRSAKFLNQLITNSRHDVTILSVFHSIDSAVQGINQLKPDLVFLDVKMPKGTCFDILDQVEKIDFEIIFTTAYENYAIQAIKFSALDYLLKPIDSDELGVALKKAEERFKSDSQMQVDLLLDNVRQKQPAPLEKIALPVVGGYRFVEVRRILYCEADGSYCRIYQEGQTSWLVSRNLRDIENLLSLHPFFRVHRSYLINLNHAKEYIGGENASIKLSNDSVIPVSQRKKESFVLRFTKLSE